MISFSSISADGLSQLKNFNDNVNELKGDFTQEVKNNKGSKKTSGNFAISRPQYFKWEYAQPHQQIIVGDGRYIWMFDVDLKQVVKKKQNTALGESPAAILANKNALDKTYTLKNDVTKNGVEYVLATPKKDDTGYQYIKIGFKNNQLVQMDLKDSFGNQSIIDFKNITNTPSNKAIYTFKPPKGVDVLEE
ncbi:outer membrane lipoprotein chaperone LolA [Neisseriaceae bacterium PsAf]|nr:outer membrane lipoprotein chaperone LolA [Neisseriaceae bacterium PsAf]